MGCRMRFLIGFAAVLLTASLVLKVFQEVSDPFADIRSGNPRWLNWSAIFIELITISAVLSGNLRRAWLCCFACFTVFLAVSAFKMATGARSCGCFGNLEVAPSVTFGVNLVILALFLICSRVLNCNEDVAAAVPVWTSKWLGWCAGCSVAFGCCLILLAAPKTGHQDIEASVRHIGIAEGDAMFEVVLRNSSPKPVHIIGVEKSCKCVVADGIAASIPAMGDSRFRVLVHASGEGNEFVNQRILVYLGGIDQFRVDADLVGPSRSN